MAVQPYMQWVPIKKKKKIIPETSSHSKDLLKEKTINSFLLKDTEEKESIKLILPLHNKKVLGPISTTVSSLKENVYISSGPISCIINLYFKEWLYPESL